MVLGFVSIALGYALFYWGYHHFPNQPRYSLYTLLGFGTLFKNLTLTPGQPIQWRNV